MFVHPISPVVHKGFKNKLRFVFAPGNNYNGVNFTDRLFLTFGLGADDVRRADPSRADDKRLLDILEHLSQKARIATPRLLVYDSDRPNAASMLLSGSVAIANSLPEGRTDDEIEVVLAHELAHHRHRPRDVLFTMLAPLGVGLGYGAKISPKLHAKLPNKKSSVAFGAVETVGLLGTFLAYRSAYARDKEYEADHESAELTGKPRDMINMLESLTYERSREEKEFDRGPRGRSFLEQIINTHPPTQSRVEELERIEKSQRNSLSQADFSR